MIKAPVKFSKDWHKTVGGVVLTTYKLSIPFDSIRPEKCKKVTKINLRIIYKPHAHLQTVQKVPTFRGRRGA